MFETDATLSTLLTQARAMVAHYSFHVANPAGGKPARWHDLMRASLSEWTHKLDGLTLAWERGA